MDMLKVKNEDADVRLDVYLTNKLDQIPTRSLVKKLITNGHVKVNESPAKANYTVRPGDDIEINIPQNFLTPKYAEPQDIKLNIFYQDDHLLIINKPSGLLVHPAANRYKDTLVNALLNLKIGLSDGYEDLRPGIVHRLDEETSGLIIIAKDNVAHARLARQFQQKRVKKKYIALVEGKVEFDEGVIDAPLGRHKSKRDKKDVIFDGSGKESITSYRVIKRSEKCSLVALFPKTGRTHQLRVHMKHIKHPILGDGKYGKRSTFPRLALHAQSIGFTHPFTKNFCEFSSPIPKEFIERMTQC